MASPLPEMPFLAQASRGAELSSVGQDLSRVPIRSLYPAYMLSICFTYLFQLWFPAPQGGHRSPNRMSLPPPWVPWQYIPKPDKRTLQSLYRLPGEMREPRWHLNKSDSHAEKQLTVTSHDYRSIFQIWVQKVDSRWKLSFSVRCCLP